MEKQKKGPFVVGEEFQTHPWSHQAGGYTVEIVTTGTTKDGRNFPAKKLMERVKSPVKYIPKIAENEKTRRISIDGTVIWTREDGYLVVIEDRFPSITDYKS